ncbi:hypothetical protein [Arthrobacter dokdonensis]|uniref:hypothetical protein n=1 Tax=Arthrobacter dokdonellae TaxID=2211210 RepID=UPI001D130F8D|nr:hypothetical protein [Arthrobacter dokdonellae]
MGDDIDVAGRVKAWSTTSPSLIRQPGRLASVHTPAAVAAMWISRSIRSVLVSMTFSLVDLPWNCCTSDIGAQTFWCK